MISHQLIQVVLCSFIVAFISFVGFGAVAEKIYAMFSAVFGRKAYKAYINGWKELNKAKQELKSVSAQDEFAKWARLQRKIDTMQADFDQSHSSRKRSAMATEFVISIAVRVIMYSALFWWGFWKGCTEPVKGLDLTVLGPIGQYLSFPYLQKGEISVCALLILSVVSFKHLLVAFRPTVSA